MRYFLEDLKPILIIVLVIVIGCSVIAGVVDRITFKATLCGIERLRHDASISNVFESEDVVGQVATKNQDIATKKQYRKYWWGKIILSSGWESVEFIDINHNEQP